MICEFFVGQSVDSKFEEKIFLTSTLINPFLRAHKTIIR